MTPPPGLPAPPTLRILASSSSAGHPTTEDLGLFLYDLALLFDLHRLAIDPGFADYKFSRFSLYRHGRPIPDAERLRVIRLAMNSPLDIAASIAAISVGAASAIWAALQTIERVYNLRPNRRKLELENDKLALEVESYRRKLEATNDSYHLQADEAIADLRLTPPGGNSEALIRSVERRLQSSSIQITDLDWEVLRDTDTPARADTLDHGGADDRRLLP